VSLTAELMTLVQLADTKTRQWRPPSAAMVTAIV
jgi:hypothetical protein